ncbi:putative F-box/LRR-repeat protein 23 [Salvia divinorum]|uniref:F-box/LRR-repeat protein 23 n=1 Tax=Salvia divinorum TaxID=28513 RepID=A0ABD1HDJ9_SALDI
MQHERQWEALPSLALAHIFRKISITDRSRTIPFVCRSWARAARHPPCWAFMIADAYSPPPHSAADHAFVIYSRPDPLIFVDPFDGRRIPDPRRGVFSFQSLILRAGAASVTSIYFFPFLTAAGGPPNDDVILRIIAQCCPNLKHLTFHGSHNASQEALFEVIHTCNKLELVDFSDSPYFEPTILQELSKCCPKIRGIRRNGGLESSFSSELSVGFPLLSMLNVSNSTLVDKDLLTIVDGCKKLRYLDVRGCQFLIFYMHIIKVASARIASIMYD